MLNSELNLKVVIGLLECSEPVYDVHVVLSFLRVCLEVFVAQFYWVGIDGLVLGV